MKKKEKKEERHKKDRKKEKISDHTRMCNEKMSTIQKRKMK